MLIVSKHNIIPWQQSMIDLLQSESHFHRPACMCRVLIFAQWQQSMIDLSQIESQLHRLACMWCMLISARAEESKTQVQLRKSFFTRPGTSHKSVSLTCLLRPDSWTCRKRSWRRSALRGNAS